MGRFFERFYLIGKAERMLAVASGEDCGNDADKALLTCSKEAGTLVIHTDQRQSWSYYNLMNHTIIICLRMVFLIKQESSSGAAVTGV
jgi:hypothetical protein